MRAVTGTITSREVATIKQASKVISKFRKAIANGARRDVAAYLSRTSAIVQDLYLFHRELGKNSKTLEQQKQEASVEIKETDEKISSHAAMVNEAKIEEEKDNKRKKKRSREVKLENGVAVGEIDRGSDKREKKKKKIKIEE